MSLSVIDLGELTLASSTSAIELTITSAATLDASAGTNHARSITLAHLMAPPADKPLIRVSRLLTFTINLMIDQNVADSTGAQVLLRNFVHCLKSAQVFIAMVCSYSLRCPDINVCSSGISSSLYQAMSK
jgi:hypothetical protein